MSRVFNIPGKAGILEDHKIPAGFLPGDVLTEYLRQTFHLFRGTAGERRVEQVSEDSLALWCLRRNRHFKTMQCALFPSKADGQTLPILTEILARNRPDAATIRVLRPPQLEGSNRVPARLRIIGGYLLLSLGQDVSLEFLKFNGDFENFLGALGKKTRSHTRSSLRTFVREGYGYRFDAPVKLETSPEIIELSARNMPNAPPAERVDLHTVYINQQKIPFQSTLSAPDGATISIIRGYLIDGHAALVDQINPESYPKIGQTGPSLLHRALLIRTLIDQGVQGLIVTGGCGGMLTRYCRQMAFDSFLALSLNPLTWLGFLRYFAGHPGMGRWALGRFLGRFWPPNSSGK